MKAIDYIKKVKEICAHAEDAGKCASDACPLYHYGCGLPNDRLIADAIDFVGNFDAQHMPWVCPACGYNTAELKSTVNFCPICGTKIALGGAGNTDQEQ